MEVGKGSVSTVHTYIPIFWIKYRVKVHRQRIQKLTGVLSQNVNTNSVWYHIWNNSKSRLRIQKLTGTFSQKLTGTFLQNLNTREDDRFLLDFYLSSAHSQLLTLYGRTTPEYSSSPLPQTQTSSYQISCVLTQALYKKTPLMVNRLTQERVTPAAFPHLLTPSSVHIMSST